MQVPLEDIDYDPDGPPCTPFPGSILALGDYRYLGMDGRLLTIPASYQDVAADLAASAAEYGDDPQIEVGSIYGDPVHLTSRTLTYWEEAAQRGGYVLGDLLA